MNLTIRSRMAFLYFGVLALSFIAFFWICDTGFQRSIETTVNDSSRTNLETVERLIASTEGKGEDAVANQLRDLAPLWSSGALFEVADEHAAWLYRSDAFLHASPSLPQAPLSGVSFFTTNLNANQYRIAMARKRSGSQSFEIHTAVPTEPFDQALDRFRLIEQETLPVLVLLASLLGYWLSAKSLAPVDRIIRTAEQVGVDNLSRRLEVPEPRDELRRLTETLNAMLGRIETSFQRITQFTADASHDLRTPVAVIRTSAELSLRRPRTPADYREALQKILQTSIETSELLENLLTLARTDAGAIGMEMHRLDLGQHVRKAQEHARILSSDKQLDLSLRVPESPVWVRADAVAIDRLLLILVDNAVKYTPRGGKCEIELLCQSEHAEITVRDTGLGIPENDLSSIFERFTRVNRARSRDIPGSGLGLAIARWITDVHGGTISAQSRIGCGSAFQVRLPALVANCERKLIPKST
jgi:heavy metal sensor kinase